MVSSAAIIQLRREKEREKLPMFIGGRKQRKTQFQILLTILLALGHCHYRYWHW